LVLTSATAEAEVISVTLGTSSLTGHPPGTFAVDFQFTDGTGIGDNNNRVKLSGFMFGGGSALPPAPPPTGDVTGSLGAQPIILSDSQGFNEFIESFNPGSQLRFTVDLTTNPDQPPTVSDTFTFAILQNGLNVPTTNPDGSDTFFEVNITASGPVVVTAGSAPGSGFSIAPPAVQQVPEPGTGVLFLVGGAGLAVCRWWRWRGHTGRYITVRESVAH
jgi:hypothetical protein